jgi:hypothetical protein
MEGEGFRVFTHHVGIGPHQRVEVVVPAEVPLTTR